MIEPDFYARYEEMGVESVREKLNLGHISGRGIAPAQEWLRQKDAARDASDRAARDAVSAEERRTARSAKNAAWAAAIAAIIAAIAAIAAAVIAYRGPPPA
jgi:hypothetical protein